jgi:hypothetical protein
MISSSLDPALKQRSDQGGRQVNEAVGGGGLSLLDRFFYNPKYTNRSVGPTTKVAQAAKHPFLITGHTF